MMRYLKFSPIIFFLFFSCTKEDVKEKLVADFTITNEVDHFTLSDHSNVENGENLTHQWISMCDSISITSTSPSTASFVLPELSESSKLAVKYIVSNGLSSDSIIKYINLPKSASLALDYGLGNTVQEEQSNNVNYNWYFDQYNSGRYADVNCGPTSTTMAIKWVNESFNKTPEDARNAILPRGGWWYTNNVIDYLNTYSINNYTIKINQIDAIKDEIDKGNIAILCLDMYYIRNETNQQYHVDKFYRTNATGWGHFIIAKGYKVVDGHVFYEIYDPNSWGLTYQDGALKGIDRYYRSSDLNKAVTTWWSYAIIASKSNLKSSTLSVDVNKIEHKPGL